MSERILEKTDVTVDALVQRVADGSLLLPEMQRQYVWRATRVRDLLDSLYRGYPSGAILVWNTREGLPTRRLAVEAGGEPLGTPQLLLDGQQRLTSLSAVLCGTPLIVRGRRRPIDILFNLDHPDTLEEVTEVSDDEVVPDEEVEALEEEEESLPERLRRLTFVVENRLLASQPNWVSVSDVFRSAGDGEFLQKAGVKSFDDPRYQKYSERLTRLRSIKKYRYTVHVLGSELSYEEVTEIFVRVNSLGVKLRSSDLALAQISARWKNVLAELEAFQGEAEGAGFTLELGLLVRAMVVFASGQARFKSLAGISIESLRDGWKRAKPALLYAMNLLRANGGVEDESLLSSPFFLITLAYFYERAGERIPEREVGMLLEWALVGSSRGYYSGSSETKLDADLVRIRGSAGAEALLANLQQLYGRKRFDATDFVGRNAVSGLFSLMFLAMRRAGAASWRTGLEISLAHRGTSHVIQFHHIFPKALLKDRYEQREINDIANLGFLGGRDNREIAAGQPEKYLGEVLQARGPRALELHCIPVEPGLWKLEAYPAFLARRRELLADAVNRFLDDVRGT